MQQCACPVKYSIMVNGAPIGNVNPGRRLRQGDPLSPYLFLMVADVLSRLMSKAVLNKSIRGLKMRKRYPEASHLLFTDDSLVFMEALPQSCTNFMDLMKAFSEASGLSLNVNKSSICFSANTSQEIKDDIKRILGMEEMGDSAQYLELLTFWGQSKREALGFLRDRIIRKTQGWANLHLNQASKEVLIKSVLQSIPLYSLMCFKLPLSICKCLNSIISKFWWGSSNSERSIHWGAWYKLTDPKSMGGLSFKDFEAFNVALLAKQFWRLIQSPNSLWARVIKGLYFPNKSWTEAVKGPKPSWIWSSLFEGRKLIQQG